MDEPECILSLSYGKDSLGCLPALEQLGWPLHRIIHAEVWATDTIPADLPPMVEFKKKADRIIKERWGIEVEHVCATTTYERCFYSPITKQAEGFENRIGLNRGFPYRKGPWCQRDLKIAPMDAVRKKTFERDIIYKIRSRGHRMGEKAGWPMVKANECQKELKVSAIKTPGAIQYIGIAADEPERFHDLSETKKSPLVAAGWTEAMCRKWCEENDLLSPIYTTATRGGCWFCHSRCSTAAALAPQLPRAMGAHAEMGCGQPSAFQGQRAEGDGLRAPLCFGGSPENRYGRAWFQMGDARQRHPGQIPD